MGFRISVSYSNSSICPIKVNRGEALVSGILADSISASTDGTFDVLWSGSSDFTADGELCIITFGINKNALGSGFSLSLSYSKDDTFNENWKDVNLNCESVKYFLLSEEGVTEINQSFIQRLLSFLKELINRLKSFLTMQSLSQTTDSEQEVVQ